MEKDFSKLIDIISEISGENKQAIKKSDKLIDDMDFDSLMIIDLIQTIENEYGLVEKSIDYKELNEDITVGEVWSLILKKLGINVSKYEKNVSSINSFPEIIEFDEVEKKYGDKVPYFIMDEGVPTNYINEGGKSYVNYSTYNYLGLNGDSDVKEAAKAAIDRYGTSVSGSRLLGGEIKIHEDLEHAIAKFLGTEDSIVQVGGHSTNVNMIGNIVNEKDLIVHDELAHNSIVEGARLSHAMRRSFKHNDMESLEKVLKRLRNNYRRTLVIVEGAYSMDGDICDLPKLLELKGKYGCILMIDEAHSFGTVGKRGAGVCDYFDIDPKNIDILMGTLSKTCASCGGYIAGSQALINYLKYNSPGFVFSAGITPANTASALAAINIFKNDQSRLLSLKHNSKALLNGIRNLGYNTGNSKDTPIIPIILGESEKAMQLSKYLRYNGINALPIIYPAVKESEARIRFFVSSMHTEKNIKDTLHILNEFKTREIK